MTSPSAFRGRLATREQHARIDTPERKAALEKAVEDLVGTIKDERVQKRYRMDLRLKLSNLFYEESRRARGKSGGRDGGWRDGKGSSTDRASLALMEAPDTPAYGVERSFCTMCLMFPELFERHFERISQLTYSNELHSMFMVSLVRIATDLAEGAVTQIYNKLDERFYQILQEAIASAASEGDAGKASTLRRWDALTNRLQILREDPPEDFVEMLFLNYADMLELRMLERELEQETRAMEENLTEESWHRFQALKQDLARRREECLRDEQELAERAVKMRAAPKTSASA